ncbi:MAG: type III pantothenate kinase [Bacteroidota bacterium]
MLLAIDVGNTDIVFGLFQDSRLTHQWRVPVKQHTQTQRLTEAYRASQSLDFSQVRHIILSSVVPGVTPGLVRIIKTIFPISPLMVGPSLYASLPFEVLNPEEIGTDLVANCVAAYDRFQGPCIIVDFGTALTFTVISDKKRIEGVAIAPGLRTSMKALFQNTAQLPEVPLEMPESALGKGTVHALQAGILIGYVGLVKHLLASIQAELHTKAKVIATGGLSHILTPLSAEFDMIDRLLTLDGLRLLAEAAFPDK